MPVVPIIDSPSVSPEVGGAQPFAAPDVEQMKNFAPEQGQKFGAAVQAGGQQMMKIGDMLQDQIDEANTKAADSWYTAQAQRALFDPKEGYLNTIGLKAKDSLMSTKERLIEFRSKAEATLTNDMQKKMFSAVVQKHELNFGAQMDTHAIRQIRVYAAGESEAREKQYVDLAIADPANRAAHTATAVEEANTRADLLELPKDSSQRKLLVQGAYQSIHIGVANDMISNNKFIDAKAYIEKAYKDGQMDAKTHNVLFNAAETGYKKDVAVATGDRIFESNNLPSTSDSGSIIDYVIKHNEGEVVVRDGDGTTKFGINSKANKMTDAQVANLTLDQAREIYHKKYWKAIDADNLDPKIRAMAYDTAVNQGPEVAKRLLKESGGDLTKFAQLRRENYQKVVEANPEKAQYLKGWMRRVDRMEAIGNGKTRTMSSMLAEADDIPDREQREMVQTRIKNRWSEDESIRTQDYQEVLRRAQDIAFARDGGWNDVPAMLMSKLSEKDRQELRNRPKVSDTDTLLELQMDPSLWVPGKIEAYRPKLSESDYRQFAAKGSGPDGAGKVLDATVDKDMLDASLNSAGLTDYVSPNKDENKAKRVALNVKIENLIEVEQQRKGNKLTRQEKQRLIDDVIMDKATVSGTLWDTEKRVMEMTDDELKSSYVYLPSGKKFNIGAIEMDDRKKIVGTLLKRGDRVTEQNIAQLWLDWQKEKSKR